MLIFFYKILQSFGIMDYSLLLGIHNLEKERNNQAIEAFFDAKLSDPLSNKVSENANGGASSHPGPSQQTPIIKTVNKFDKVFNM
jgi:hypothetical protein